MFDLSQFARTINIASAGCAALLVAACATVTPAPTARLAVADAAIADAASADAPQYAAADFRNAQRKLNRAHDEAAQGDYAHAQDLAEEAEVDARLAATRAPRQGAAPRAAPRARPQGGARRSRSAGKHPRAPRRDGAHAAMSTAAATASMGSSYVKE